MINNLLTNIKRSKAWNILVLLTVLIIDMKGDGIMNMIINEAGRDFAILAMSEERKRRKKHSHENQMDTRPSIDDAVCHYLDGKALKDALRFIENIRKNKMKIKWSSVNTWSVYHKRKHVSDIKIGNGIWGVSLAKKQSNERYMPRNVESIWSLNAIKEAIKRNQKSYQAS